MSVRKALSSGERSAALALELRAVFGKLKRKLREQTGEMDLSPSQVAVLLQLEKDGPVAIANLARAAGIRHQSMSATVASLQEAGLVLSSPDPNDKRQTLVSLSRKCQMLLKESYSAMHDWLTLTIQNKLSAREQEKLAAAVALMAKLVED
jgi:DNA-binding MarR family transcriptional regulator